ncbi:MAG: hypothetical protein H8E55_72370, partial [Pelagibacterales bacterium]|nr:hypothetical protein [Pelagibacterales bacterium]
DEKLKQLYGIHLYEYSDKYIESYSNEYSEKYLGMEYYYYHDNDVIKSEDLSLKQLKYNGIGVVDKEIVYIYGGNVFEEEYIPNELFSDKCIKFRRHLMYSFSITRDINPNDNQFTREYHRLVPPYEDDSYLIIFRDQISTSFKINNFNSRLGFSCNYEFTLDDNKNEIVKSWFTIDLASLNHETHWEEWANIKEIPAFDESFIREFSISGI